MFVLLFICLHYGKLISFHWMMKYCNSTARNWLCFLCIQCFWPDADRRLPALLTNHMLYRFPLWRDISEKGQFLKQLIMTGYVLTRMRSLTYHASTCIQWRVMHSCLTSSHLMKFDIKLFQHLFQKWQLLWKKFELFFVIWLLKVWRPVWGIRFLKEDWKNSRND